MKYILVGNPNVGKTTFFNLITKSNNKVSNFSGTTVDIVSGQIRGSADTIVDIPGIRSLVHDSEDERVAVQSVLDGDFDVVVNILDVTNLRRNLYLSIQLLEAGYPMLFVLNMEDELQQGQAIDVAAFTKSFGNAKLIGAKKEKDVDGLITFLHQKGTNNFLLDYGEVVETAVSKIEHVIVQSKLYCRTNPRFIALQLLASNQSIWQKLDRTTRTLVQSIREDLEQAIIEQELAQSINGLLFRVRREYIHRAMPEVMRVEPQEVKVGRLDSLLLNKYIGIPVFILLFYFIFYLTFLIGDPISAFLESAVFGTMGEWLQGVFVALQLPDLFISLLIDGAFAGVTTVVMFLPQIILVFVFLSLLEGSGYMSRAVILFDKTLSQFGLNGKALAPMMIGFGCNVPAIMATRTIANRKERLITQLIIPFISCSARLEIYILFIGVFFSRNQALILMFMNFLGVFVAVVSAKIFSLSLFRRQESFFLVEMPPYRTINFQYIYKMTMNKVMQFLTKAGTFIIVGSMAIWFLVSFGLSGYTNNLDDSFFALIGHTFAWLFAPLGFGTWQATSSLITGFLAKELVVAQIGVLLASYPTVNDGITQLFTPAAALSFMVFNLLYIPCLSTIAVLKQETKSNGWVLFSVGYSFIAAYIVSFIVYQLAALWL